MDVEKFKDQKGSKDRHTILKHVKNWISGFDSSTNKGIATLYTGKRKGE